jgi:hypothetical protein
MKLLWIQVNDPSRASRLAELLESNGLRADVGRTVRGEPEVRIQKPRLRRMEPFMDDLESVVDRWLEEEPANDREVVVRTIDEVFEIQNPRAHAPRARSAAPG